MPISRREFIRLGLCSSFGLWLGSCHQGSAPGGATLQDAQRRAELHYDSGMLEKSLERILKWHEQHNPAFPDLLLPGLETTGIEKKAAQLPFDLPEEVHRLYMWRNGTARSTTDDWPPFLWYHRFMRLEDAISTYERLTGLTYRTIMGWQKSWFPLFDFQEEYYYIDCATTSQKATPIWHYLHEDPDDLLSFTNLTTMLQTAAEWFESGAVGMNKDGGFTENMSEIKKIHNKLNPGAVFPYYVSE